MGLQTKYIWNYRSNFINFKLQSYLQKEGWSCLTLDFHSRPGEIYYTFGCDSSKQLVIHGCSSELKAIQVIFTKIKDHIIFKCDNEHFESIPSNFNTIDILSNKAVTVSQDLDQGIIGHPHPFDDVCIPKGEKWW